MLVFFVQTSLYFMWYLVFDLVVCFLSASAIFIELRLLNVILACLKKHSFYPPFASIAKGEVFGLLYVCLFVNDFSTTRGPIHAIFCMRA